MAKPLINNLKELINIIYPVGSIYMSVNSTSPQTLFGGTWTQLKDRFLLGAGSTYSNGATGGAATHTLTVDQIPSHRHTIHGRIDRYQGSGTVFREPYGYNESGGNDNNIESYATGGGKSHNNMPPYLVVYMWKRTA